MHSHNLGGKCKMSHIYFKGIKCNFLQKETYIKKKKKFTMKDHGGYGVWKWEGHETKIEAIIGEGKAMRFMAFVKEKRKLRS